jgi:hypothetical protein
MRAYIVTTGAAFGLLTLAHISRMFEDRFQERKPRVFTSRLSQQPAGRDRETVRNIAGAK